MEQATAANQSPWKNIIGWAIAIIVLGIALDFGLGYFIQSIFSDAEYNKALAPFQNQYLSFKHPFLTSEFIKSNDDDPGRWSRFFSEGILVILGWGIVLIILRVIPATRNISTSLLRYGSGILLVLLFIHVAFFPKVKSVFNQQERKLIVTRTHYYFFMESERTIPFEQITGFESQWVEVTGFSTTQYAGVMQLFANTGSEKIFIGETRVDSHSPQDDAWVARATEKNQVIAHEAIHTLEKLIREN